MSGSRDPKWLGPDAIKVHPRLRMIRNGSRTVNTIRAEHAGCLRVRGATTTPRLRGDAAAPLVLRDADKLSGKLRKRKLRSVPAGIDVSMFVTLSDDAAGWAGDFSARTANLRTTTRPLNALGQLLDDPYVQFLEPGEALKAPTPLVHGGSPAAPAVDRWRVGSAAAHHDGAGVLIGIIDVQGFDFAHADFLDESGGTRWARIWDQGGSARPSPAGRSEARGDGLRGFDYGAEFTRADLDAAIAASAGLGVPAQEIERQSQTVPGSHGTHVASIAGGNRGICRKALLAGVLVDLTDEDMDRRRSFYDSTRVAEAIEYLLALSFELGPMPVSINISLGTNGHAHDASSALSRWIDSALSTRGRAVSVAAGNAGQENPLFEGDVGFVMGRIHASGRVPAAGLTRDLRWRVVGNRIADLSENELEIWHPAQDRFSVQVKPPEQDWLPPVRPGQFIENHQLGDGSYVSVYNELYHHANGENYVGVYLSPLLSREAIVGVPAGEWIVRLIGEEIHDGFFHAWIERDDPRRLGPFGEREAWRFPSFFEEGTYVDDSTVSSLACGLRVLSVANLDAERGRVSPTSSQGPTRDGRLKPDIAAPGTGIVAARGFDPEAAWVGMSGTSMASPFVCGVAALMLAVDSELSAAQIHGIMRRTARPLPGADFRWRNDAGFGEIDAERCVAEAESLRQRTDVTP
ncbi:MAG: S8 family serine peptidase [Gemmatimonadota bacterium]